MADMFLDMCDDLGLFFGEDGIDYNTDTTTDSIDVADGELDDIGKNIEPEPDDDYDDSGEWSD